MNNKSATLVLIALSALLGVGLYLRHTNAVEQKKKDDGTIAELEGTVKKTTGELTTQKQVNDSLTASLTAKTEEAKALTAKVETTTAELGQTKTALTKSQAETKRVETTLTASLNAEKAKAEAEAKAAAARYTALDTKSKQEIATRDASIKDLQNTRDQLNAKVASLNADIAKLNSTIGTLNARITLVEGELQVAKDDKAFLTKELGRMQAERTELERKMNDLAFLREQMSTIKSDQAIAQRMDWMRRGIFMDERKGGQLLNEGLKPLSAAKPTSTKGSQLNVEVHRDGTVTIKAPAPAAPKPAQGGVEKSVTVGPDFPGATTPKKK
jgi:chromosome segregation ATPase